MISALKIAIFSVAITSTGSMESGLQFKITKEGIQKSIDQTLPSIEHTIQKIELKESDFSENEGPKVYYLNIEITPTPQSKSEKVTVSFNQKSNSVQLELSGYSIKASYCIDFKGPIMGGKTTGSVSFALKKLSPIFTLNSKSMDTTSLVDVKIDELVLKDDKVENKDEGFFSGALTMLTSPMKNTMLSFVSALVKSKIESLIQTKLNQFITTNLPQIQQIPKTNVSISTKFSQPPKVGETEIDFFFYGVFFKNSEGEPKEFAHSSLENVVFDKEKTASFVISKSTIESLIKSSYGMEYSKSYNDVFSYSLVLKSEKAEISISKTNFFIKNLSFDFIAKIDINSYLSKDFNVPVCINVSFEIAGIDYEKRKLKISKIEIQVLDFLLSEYNMINDASKYVVKEYLSKMTEIEIDIFLIPKFVKFESFTFSKADQALLFQTDFDFSSVGMDAKALDKIII